MTPPSGSLAGSRVRIRTLLRSPYTDSSVWKPSSRFWRKGRTCWLGASRGCWRPQFPWSCWLRAF